MKVVGIDHCTVVVTEVEAAVYFYSKILGLPEVSSPSTFAPAGLRVRWFRAGNQYIHLYQSTERDSLSPRHFALEVEDAARARQHFLQRNITIKETVKIPGADRFFVNDPDGNRIEIIQWIDKSAIVPLPAPIDLNEPV